MMRKRGRPRKEGVERTASGRISRKRQHCAQFFTVYIAAFPGGLVKVGRTCDVHSRMSALRSISGEPPIVCAEIHISDIEDSITLERHAIDLLDESGHERQKREWFYISRESLPKIVEAIVSSSPVDIIRQVTLGPDVFESSLYDDHANGIRRLLTGHRVNEMLM